MRSDAPTTWGPIRLYGRSGEQWCVCAPAHSIERCLLGGEYSNPNQQRVGLCDLNTVKNTVLVYDILDLILKRGTSLCGLTGQAGECCVFFPGDCSLVMLELEIGYGISVDSGLRVFE